MSTSLSSITDFFNFFNLPISILDNNFSIIYKRCYEEKEQQLFYELNISEDLKNLNFKPSRIQLDYEDDITITTILFYDNKKPMFLVIGPYKSTDTNANFVTNSDYLYHLTSLITNIFMLKFSYKIKRSNNESSCNRCKGNAWAGFVSYFRRLWL